MAPFGEIVANPSNLKHAGELLRCSDGLGVVILAHAHRWDDFYSVYGTTQSGMGRRLVLITKTAPTPPSKQEV